MKGRKRIIAVSTALVILSVAFSACRVTEYDKKEEKGKSDDVLIEQSYPDISLENLKSSVIRTDNFISEKEKALLSASPIGGNPMVYVLEEGLTYYVCWYGSTDAFKCELKLPQYCENGNIIYASKGAGSGEVSILAQAVYNGEKAYLEYIFFLGDNTEQSASTPVYVSVLPEKPEFIERY